MKKTLIIVLAALVLICAVSCDEAKKDLGTLKLDTKTFESYFEEEDLAKITSAKIALGDNDEATIKVDMKDVEKGTVSIKLPAGIYENVFLCFFSEEGEPVGKIRCGEALTVAQGVTLRTVTIDAGQVTFCRLLSSSPA